jgi:hypothetical protein
MIKINEDFEFERDPQQWVLHEWRDGVNPKTKEPTRVEKITYHGTLHQVCSAVIERNSGKCESLKEVMKAIEATKADLLTSINQHNEG